MTVLVALDAKREIFTATHEQVEKFFAARDLALQSMALRPGLAKVVAGLTPSVNPDRCFLCNGDIDIGDIDPDEPATDMCCAHGTWSICMQQAGLPQHPVRLPNPLEQTVATTSAMTVEATADGSRASARQQQTPEWIEDIADRLDLLLDGVIYPVFVPRRAMQTNLDNPERREESPAGSLALHKQDHDHEHPEDRGQGAQEPRAARGSTDSRKHRAKPGVVVHPFPYPRPSRKTTGNGAFYRSVWRWARKQALQALNAAQEALEPVPDPDALAEWIEALVLDRGARYITCVEDTGGITTRYPSELFDTDVVRLAASVADLLLVQGEWDPEFMNVARARGGAGGRASRRGPKFTPDMLDGLVGLTAKEQAEVVGCSERQVFALRKQRIEYAK